MSTFTRSAPDHHDRPKHPVAVAAILALAAVVLAFVVFSAAAAVGPTSYFVPAAGLLAIIAGLCILFVPILRAMACLIVRPKSSKIVR
jgi:hypothetical protein